MKHTCIYIVFILYYFFILFFQDHASQATTYLEAAAVPWLNGKAENKEKFAHRSRERQRKFRSRPVNLGDQVHRWKELRKGLQVCDRKLGKLLLDP